MHQILNFFFYRCVHVVVFLCVGIFSGRIYVYFYFVAVVFFDHERSLRAVPKAEILALSSAIA